MLYAPYFASFVPAALVFLACVYHPVSAISPTYHILSVPAEIYVLPVLTYGYDGLEPYITRDMVVAHYEGHHEAYRRKMNAALNEWREDVSYSKRHCPIVNQCTICFVVRSEAFTILAILHVLLLSILGEIIKYCYL